MRGQACQQSDPQKRMWLVPGKVEGDERRPGRSMASLLLNQTHEPSSLIAHHKCRAMYQIRDMPCNVKKSMRRWLMARHARHLLLGNGTGLQNLQGSQVQVAMGMGKGDHGYRYGYSVRYPWVYSCHCLFTTWGSERIRGFSHCLECCWHREEGWDKQADIVMEAPVWVCRIFNHCKFLNLDLNYISVVLMLLWAVVSC